MIKALCLIERVNFPTVWDTLFPPRISQGTDYGIAFWRFRGVFMAGFEGTARQFSNTISRESTSRIG